jgi:hypothetical protein
MAGVVTSVSDIFGAEELCRNATIRKFRIVRTEGRREMAREVEHYNLDAILAVGFPVSSHEPRCIEAMIAAQF